MRQYDHQTSDSETGSDSVKYSIFSMPYFALLVVFVSWGTGFVATKIAISEGGFTPLYFNGLRFAVCGVILFLVSLASGAALPRNRREWRRISVSSLLSVIGGNFFLTIALLYINGGMAPVITSLESSIFIVACFFAGERFARTVWIGLGIGFSGLVVMFWQPITVILTDPSTEVKNYVFALFFLFLTAICWGVGGYWVRHHQIKTPIFMQTAIQYIIGCIVFLLLAMFTEEISVSSINLNAWLAFLYISIFTTVFGYASFMYVIPRLPANVTATKSYMIPLISILTGFILLNEKLSSTQIIGGVIILTGIVVVNLGKTKKD